jgi:hypothetical protein
LANGQDDAEFVGQAVLLARSQQGELDRHDSNGDAEQALVDAWTARAWGIFAV